LGATPLPMELRSKGVGLLRAPLRFGFFCPAEKAGQKRATCLPAGRNPMHPWRGR